MQRVTIKDETLRQRAVDYVMAAPVGSLMTLREGDGRSGDQNARLHAALTDISKQVEWHGMKLSMEVWKRLCVAAFLREHNEKPMMVPAIDGQGIELIYEKTSTMSKRMMADLITWVDAFGSQNGVQWSEKAREE